MSIDYIIDDVSKSSYVRLTCRGTYTQESLLRTLDDACILTLNKGHRSVLIDVRAVKGTPPDIYERFIIGVETVRIQRKNKTIVTIVIVGNEPMIDPKRFGETVALNRGGIGKVFTNIGEAESWLFNNG